MRSAHEEARVVRRDEMTGIAVTPVDVTLVVFTPACVLPRPARDARERGLAEGQDDRMFVGGSCGGYVVTDGGVEQARALSNSRFCIGHPHELVVRWTAGQNVRDAEVVAVQTNFLQLRPEIVASFADDANPFNLLISARR